MTRIKSVLLALLSILIGTTFLYSAFTKLNSLQSFHFFEFAVIEYLHFPWWLANILSRLLSGLELALGVLIIFHFYGNLKWILKLANGLLVLFSLYLVYLWIAVGNDINCGCFGDEVFMSPAASLAKNVLMMGAIVLLIKKQPGIHFRWAHLSSLILLIGLTSIPFFLIPMPDTQPSWLQKNRFKLDMSALYRPDNTSKPGIDLNKGKHVIAFLSLSCPHCQTAAYKMHLMKEKKPALPFYFVVAGRDENWDMFWKKTKATNVPYTRLSSDEFTGMIGYSFPVIYWINNGWVEAETNYMQLDQGQIEKWLTTGR